MSSDFSSAHASIDPRSGFCAETKTFYSIRPPLPLPSPDIPLSVPSFVFSLLPSPLPTHPALVDASTGHSLSFPLFIQHIQFLAANLHHQFGISKGDVVLVLSPTRMDLMVLYMSLFSIGAVASPANPSLTPSEISQLIHLSKPSFAFATKSTFQLLPSDLNVILLDTPHFKNLLEQASTATNVEKLKQIELRQSDQAMIQYSSGTTGRVKAAALPHRYFISIAAHHMENCGGIHPKAALTSSPMFHSMGFASTLRAIARGETTVILTAERVTVADIIQAARCYKVTEMTVAPPVVVAMTKSPHLTPLDFQALEVVICGGAPLYVQLARRFQEKFPHVQLSLGYGSTEGGGISLMIGHEECRRLRSVGRLHNNIQVKIVDPDTGMAMSAGQAGELWIKSPACMTGYIGDEEANAAAFDSDGWLKTGDLCYIDEHGFLYIIDRLKELIKYKGYQVPPAELEDVLHSHPDVVDAAVFPIADDEVGQIPAALVVRRDGSTLSETQVMHYVAKKVAPYKKIRKVLFINQIPKSPAGKILRRELSNFVLQGSLSKL